MGETCGQDRLLDEAIDLIIRYQNDSANPVAADMIAAWRARSVQHEETWMRVSKVHGASGTILTEQRRIERRKDLDLSRRSFVVGGLVALGAGVTAYTLVPGMILQARADYVTAKGEIRRIDLPDGSVATLGPESAISLGYRAEARRIDLLAGMSFFDVAADRNRPFSVWSGNVRATAFGTAFDVSSDAGNLTVSVEQGPVDVRTPDRALLAGLNLSDGEWMVLDAASGNIDRGQRERSQIGSWRDKLIIAERETVSALVARIGRWVPGRIVIADPFLGSQRVSGLFDLNNPLRALEAVVHPAGARVRRISSLVTLISPL